MAFEAKGFKVVDTRVVWTGDTPGKDFKCYREYPTENLTSQLKEYFKGQQISLEYNI